MVTSADGAEEFYTLANNEARYENVKDAIETDKKLINAWVGHPYFHIVDNLETSFKKKIERVTETVLKSIGLPCPSSFYKKFLLQTYSGEFDIQVPKSIKKEVF